MPYSSNNGKAEIKRLVSRYIKRAKFYPVRQMLDVGAGSGTYADLVNELGGNSKRDMIGVEIWAPYITEFDLTSKYQSIIQLDANTALDRLLDSAEQFACIFIGDMLEHLPRDLALALVEKCKRVLMPEGMIIISVPIGEYPQDEYMGNPHEAHVDTWTHEDVMRDLKPNSFIQRGEIGVAIIAGNMAELVLEPVLAVYMICKNEAKFIGRALGSIGDVAQVVVADTGSTDGTVELIESNPRINLAQVCINPWRFDDARNLALSLVSDDVDLCISLDADEVLDPLFVPRLKQAYAYELLQGRLPTRFNHSFKTIWDWDKDGVNVSTHFHERVHSRHNYRWVHPVHEKLVYQGTEEHIAWAVDSMMIQMPDTTKDRSSYFEMLGQSLKEDPSDWKLWSFYGSEQAQAGLLTEAIESYKQGLKQENVDEAFMYLRIAELYERLGDGVLASAYANRAGGAALCREACIAGAEMLERHGGNSLAVQFYWKALQFKVQTTGYWYSPSAWDGSLETKTADMFHTK